MERLESLFFGDRNCNNQVVNAPISVVSFALYSVSALYCVISASSLALPLPVSNYSIYRQCVVGGGGGGGGDESCWRP